MKLIWPNNCDPGRFENVGFRLVGVPVTVNEDVTVNVDGVHAAIVNIFVLEFDSLFGLVAPVLTASHCSFCFVSLKIQV